MDPFEELNDLGANLILSKLDAKSTAIVACMNRRFRDWAAEDSLWSRHCLKELGLSSPLDPDGNPASSFKAAYHLWREEFCMYKWPLVTRVKQCWDRLKSWLSANFPEVLATLRRGVSEDELNEFEKTAKVKLPLPTRVLYRLCDGQEVPDDESMGLIGGYSFYDRMVDVYLLPLGQSTRFTKKFRRQVALPSSSKYVIVGASATLIQKLFFLNCESGQLCVGTANLIDDGEMLPCVPNALISSVHGSSSGQELDALLLWLEEHARRLELGIITVRCEEGLKSICQFPEKPPLCSVAVTNGVQVRASTVFVPEACDIAGAGTHLFAYSIRMSLLPDGCTVHGMTLSSCQLYWRHWLIREDNGNEQPVSGEAVIGKYPLLRPGEKEFVYESCTPSQSRSGYIEGSFTFVPGTLRDPKGDTFEVEVARFPFEVPEYIF